MIHALVEVIAWALFRMRYVGLANVPRSGPAILAPNHISPMDPVAMALPLSRRGRTLRCLAGAEFFDRPVVGWALRALDQIPVRRGAADWSALEELAQVIRGGALAGIFPEGRVGDASAINPGKKGLARVALAAGVPVIPVGIWGTQARWPQAGFRWGRPWRPRIVVVYGRPIAAVGDPRSRTDVRELTDRVMREIAVLTARARARA